MSQDPFPGHGQDGGEPSPAPGAGNGPGDADASADDFDEAYLDRLAADIDAGLIEIPPDDAPAQGVTISLAEVTDPAAADTAGFAQGGAADTMTPGAALAALAEAACADLGTLTSNQVLGLAGAGKRLAALGTWIELAAASEFAARRRTGDLPGVVAGQVLSEFAGDELAPELKLTPLAAAEQLAYAATVTRRLPATLAALRAGTVDGYRVKIIAEATGYLSDEHAADADQVLAVSAADLTYGRLRHAAARLVMMLDPEAARRRKEAAGKNARVMCFREEAGTAGLSGRDLPVGETLASWASVKARAVGYRAAGMAGTVTELRARAFLDLLQERDARDRLDVPGGQQPATTTTTGGVPGSLGDGGSTGDGSTGGGGTGPRPAPATPPGSVPARPPLAALINAERAWRAARKPTGA
ncbi:MAG: DUF222 domain-containing protein [Streptosporangiaceae bacterium]|nr:DUF222 domain-containing protein [Streptosporangiaceae bacterium]